MLLEQIKEPQDIKDLSAGELKELAEEIRSFLIEKISVTGGHLASNLGVVELTIALFLAFDLPTDKVIWDVGHQSYTHKILSGRRELFDELRQYGGLSGNGSGAGPVGGGLPGGVGDRRRRPDRRHGIRGSE